MKMMKSPLVCMTSAERMSDHEWMQSDFKAENTGILKEDNELTENTVLSYLLCFTSYQNSEAVYPACRKRRLLGTYQLQSNC